MGNGRKEGPQLIGEHIFPYNICFQIWSEKNNMGHP